MAAAAYAERKAKMKILTKMRTATDPLEAGESDFPLPLDPLGERSL